MKLATIRPILSCGWALPKTISKSEVKSQAYDQIS